MDIVVASTGTTAALARRAARVHDPERAAAWARWTLTLEEPPPPGGCGRALAWRLANRGWLVPVGRDVEETLTERFGARAPAAAGAWHRLQTAAILAEPLGLPSRLDSDLARAGVFSSEEAAWLAEAARRDLERLIADLRALYPEESPCEGGPLYISWTGTRRAGWRNAAVADGAASGARPLFFDASPPPFRRDDAALESLARRLLGVASLRPGQAEAVAALLAGRDLALFWTTGGGKSLVYHLAALLAPGTALIVAPLRALLRDQARRLAEAGITRVGLLTGDDAAATNRGLTELAAGRLIMSLAAPERLDSAPFRDALRGAAEGPGISFVAVDEAHCAARRGHDWRPGYRVLGARVRAWSSTSGRLPALAAVSGGASPGALAEAERALGLSAPERVGGAPARRNLSFRVWTTGAADHLARLRELLTRRLPDGRFGPGIVFCPRVDGPLGAAAIAEELVWTEGIDAAAYTGRAPAGIEAVSWEALKRRAAEDFLTGRRGLLCATRAFGLGVDRADVRFTVHLGLPATLEEFYQQAGRAGRDGSPAQCWLLLHVASERHARRWARMPLEFLREELAVLKPARRDDVARAYAFHLAAFPGEEAERRDAEIALGCAGDVSAPGLHEAALPGQDPEALTRALVRLEETGVLTLESRNAFGWIVRRTGGWTPNAAREAAFARVARDYEVLEPSRRASLAELIELALSEEPGAALARRLTG